MPFSYNEIVASGSSSTINLTFGYLDRSHVHVSIDGEETMVFSWNSDTQIAFPSPPAAGSVVRAYRRTPSATPITVFGSSKLESRDLNTTSTASIYLAQEALDDASDANARSEAENARLDTLIAVETASRLGVDSMLEALIGDTNGALSAETSNRVAADQGEATIRDAADRALSNLIGRAGPVEIVDFGGIVEVSLAAIPETVQFIRTAGYFGPGLGAGGVWQKVDGPPIPAGPLWVQSANGLYFKLVELVASPNQFGAKGDGSSPLDDQAAFEKLITLVRSTRKDAGSGFGLQEFENGALIEPGIYDVGGLVNAQQGSVRYVARVPGTVLIRIPDGQYFYTAMQFVSSVHFEGITFLGGAGVYKHTVTSANVKGMHIFSRCVFHGYTVCAIQNASNDHPYLRVRECTFFAKADNTLTPIGVAWGGQLDSVIIEGNSFCRNAYHLKLGNGSELSGSFHLLNNDFISFGTIRTRSDIWMLPRPADAPTNSGFGARIEGNKFGNENQYVGNPGYPRILVAHELQSDIDAGKSRGERMPDYRWQRGDGTDGILTGIIIRNNRISSISTPNAPFILSYVQGLRSWQFVDNVYDGGMYTWGVEFAGDGGQPYTRQDWQVDIASGNGSASPFSKGFANYYVGPIADRHGHQGDRYALSDIHSLTDDLAGGVLLSDWTSASWSVATATKTVYVPSPEANPELKDPFGGTGLMDIRFTGSSGQAYITIPGITAEPGKMCWVQVRVGKADVNPLARVLVSAYNSTAGAILAQRYAIIRDDVALTKVTFAFPAPASGTIRLRVTPLGYSSGVAERVRIFGAVVTTGPQPMHGDHLRSLGSGWNVPHAVLGAYHLWVDGSGRLRIKNSAPASDTDGTVVGTQS